MRRVHCALLIALPLAAAAQAPEIRRAAATPQATGAVHTVRAIPEACTRLEGAFTGDASRPYRLTPVRTSATCRARARFVDAPAQAPTGVSGWILNDVVRVPHAACADQQAVVRVWRRPGNATPPKLDAQGRARLYLDESAQAPNANARADAIGAFAATFEVEGRCG